MTGTENLAMLQDLPNEVLLKLVSYDLDPLKLMLVNKSFLNLFAPCLYKKIHCIINLDFSVSKAHTKYYRVFNNARSWGPNTHSALSIEMATDNRSPESRKATLLSRVSVIKKFFRTVMVQEGIMKQFIKKLSFDMLFVEGFDIRMIQSSVLAEVIRKYVPKENVILFNHKKFFTMGEGYKRDDIPVEYRDGEFVHHDELYLDYVTNHLSTSRSLGLMMHMYENFANGDRLRYTPFSGFHHFKSLSVARDLIRSLDTNLAAQLKVAEGMERLKGCTTVTHYEHQHWASIFALLELVVKGMIMAPKTCDTTFCGIVTHYSAHKDTPAGYAMQFAKVLGFSTRRRFNKVRNNNWGDPEYTRYERLEAAFYGYRL